MGKKVRFLTIIALAVCCLFAFTTESKAAEYPAYTIKKGKTKSITAIINGNPLTKGKKKYKKLTWQSKKPAIVSVKKNRIKGKRKGTALLQGFDRRRKKVLSIKVTVGTPVAKISLNTSSITLMSGESFQLQQTVTPLTASNKKVFFKSSNPKVVNVTSRGMVSPVNGGNAKIYVISKDGNRKKTISVKVYSRLLRNTNFGKVRGVRLSNSLVWYGVPYGDTTAGENRWRAPKDPVMWSGVKQTTVKREGAAQYANGSTEYIGTEDCLYMNIFRPDTNVVNLPVMVYLHGGGNASSNNNRNFSSFAKATNSIVVSVEYRLGAFGFLSHPALRDGTPEENSGNFTMLDIKKALEWVQGNIGYFGGDNENVTLSGYSAGARDTMFSIISPIMQGLFHKAITFSGGAKTCTNEQGETSVESKLAAILVRRGVYETTKQALDYIKKASDEEIRELFDSLTTAEVANMYPSPALRLGNFPQGFNDGIVISVDGFDAISKGNYNRVPIILGSNMTEFASFAWNSPYVLSGEEEKHINMTTKQVLEKTIQFGSMLQTYHYIEEPAKMFLSDELHEDVYAYRFNWGTDASVTNDEYSRFVGAPHGMDVSFLLGTYPTSYMQYAPNAMVSSNAAGRKDLTNTMRQYIKNFLYYSNPNETDLVEWNTWSETSEDKVMLFDADKKYDISAMAPIYLNRDDIFNHMRMSLSEPVYDILIKNPLRGRFFMPDSVPSYY